MYGDKKFLTAGKEFMAATQKKKVGGSQSIQRVEARLASEVETNRIEAAVERLLVELVRQERNQGRLHHESTER